MGAIGMCSICLSCSCPLVLTEGDVRTAHTSCRACIVHIACRERFITDCLLGSRHIFDLFIKMKNEID
jgi:hypothetical protein